MFVWLKAWTNADSEDSEESSSDDDEYSDNSDSNSDDDNHDSENVLDENSDHDTENVYLKSDEDSQSELPTHTLLFLNYSLFWNFPFCLFNILPQNISKFLLFNINASLASYTVRTIVSILIF